MNPISIAENDNESVISASVVDVNVLKSRDLLGPLIKRAADNQTGIILAAASWFDLTKSGNWENSLRSNLRLLAGVPQVVWPALSLKKMASLEHTFGIRCADVIDYGQVRWLRSVLADVQAGRDEAAFRQMRTRAEMLRRHNEHAIAGATNARNGMRELVGLVKGHMAPAVVELRRRDQLVHLMSQSFWSDWCLRQLISQGWDHVSAEEISWVPSVSYHRYVAAYASALMWAMDGGIDTRNPEKVLSDLVDSECVVTALSCADFVTADSRAMRLYRILDDASTIRWSSPGAMKRTGT